MVVSTGGVEARSLVSVKLMDSNLDSPWRRMGSCPRLQGGWVCLIGLPSSALKTAALSKHHG